jgi:hypothetical protein
MNRYASQTSVSPEKSRSEIETLLRKYGADGYGYRTQGTRARIEFVAHGRGIRFDLDLPAADDSRFSKGEKGRRRPPAAAAKAHEQEVRRLWRALVLGIKAKLEMVSSGVTVFEQEFLAHIVLAGGKQTVGERVLPQIDAGSAKPLLLGAGAVE